MIKKVIFFVVILFLFNSCGITKIKTKESMHTISTRKLIKNYKKSLFSKKTLKAKVKIRYEDKNTTQSLSIKLRIKKDEVIWMSGSFLGIPLAKVKITPTKVQFYEKIKKTYFDGDFSLLSQMLGTEINYSQLQNLLFGQCLIYPDSKHKSIVDGQSFKLTPKKQQTLFDIFYWINPIFFKIDKQELKSDKDGQKLTISYPEYQQIADEDFPKLIIIEAIQSKQKTRIELDYKMVEFDRVLRFPFNIPDNYKKIKIKNK
jgi:hypothetical protein